MDPEKMDEVIKRKIMKAMRESLDATLENPYWAQLEEIEEDTRAPPIDIQDRDDHYLLIAEMPGIPKQNVAIKVEEATVRISGENVLECELDHEDLSYLCNERAITNFQRKVTMPGPVVPDRVEATMEHGVLIVKLPKKVEAEASGVTIKVS